MTNSTLSKFVIFATGAALGSVVTWRLVVERYRRLAQEEIDSYRGYYRMKYGSEKAEAEEEDTASESADVLQSKVVDLGYTNYSGNERPAVADEVEGTNWLEVIPPDECGELEEYDVIELQYFADEVLTDDRYILIDDADELIGKDALDCFGEWEDDSVYVRNDKRKAYYIILRDERKYSDISGI